jgi:hypothetical protein
LTEVLGAASAEAVVAGSGLAERCTLGIGAGLVAEALDGTIRSTRDVRHVMQMPPIAAIPVIKTPTDLRRDRFRRLAVATVVLVAVGAVGLYARLQTVGVI